MLPSLNQQRQGLNVQRPQIPSAQQALATNQSRTLPAMGARPFNSMAPDSGQHGGAPRYMTPQSGAQNRSVSQAMPRPYSTNQMPQRRSQAAPEANSLQPPPPSAPSGGFGGRPAVFSPSRVIQTAQTLQNAMPFNRALQERFLGSPEPQPEQANPYNQPLPPMFNR